MKDVTFVIPPQNKGWILDHIAQEIGSRIEGDIAYHYAYHNIPDSKKYWLAHYSILLHVLRFSRNVRIENCVVFFTHTSSNLEMYVPYFNKCHAVVCENYHHYNELLQAGVNQNKLSYIVECASPDQFKPKERRGDGAILISGSCRRRKNFLKIMNVIKAMPKRKFVLVTQNLKVFEKEKELRSLKNLTIHEDIYHENYPLIYGGCDIYLSCADLEGGGPNALIESMHSNLVPVVSDTGNASDYIVNGHNGFIFPIDADVPTICALINKAYDIKTDVSKTVSNFTWEEYARQWAEVLKPSQVLTESGRVIVNEV